MKYDVVGLYEHNEISYDKVKEAFKTSDVVGIVQATGTGKSYNALQLCYDNQDKKIIYVVPSLGIIEHIKSIIEENPNLSLERDFKNVEFRTYQSFLNLSKKEMESIPCDLIIDDEFHHLGAPVWGQRIKKFIELHPNVKVFGMTAYTVRDRGTIYERDMANPDTDELFSNKIVSRYDLCDAMVDKVLPKPIYKCAYIGLEKMLNEIEGKVKESSKEINELLESARKKVHEAPSIKDLVIKSIKKNGKYIYFCPPYSEKGANDIESIKKEALEWFKSILPEEDIVFYTSTSEMGTLGKKNRKAFYNDLDLEGKDAKGKLRVMFAINQYNEGIHAPNVDGVIMGRATTSDIVFFEQLGRALSVRGNTLEEYSHLINLSYEQLLQMCKDKDIPVKEDATKEDLIESLLAPIVIDLVENYEYIKELENNLQNKVKEIQSKGPGNERVIKLKNPTFDIEIENKNLYEMLENLRERLTFSWNDMYEYAKKYYEHYGNLEVYSRFKTNDGVIYDKNGKINLGSWITQQRYKLTPESEKGKLLSKIGMRFENKISTVSWEEMYEYAKKYYEHYGNLEVPFKFKTNDGYTFDEKGEINLGNWIKSQRKRVFLKSEQRQLLSQIGMRFKNKNNTASWEEMYEYAKKYYEHYGDLEVTYKFKTNDGYTFDENGKINLKSWISYQRKSVSPNSEKGQLLSQIGMRFENKISTASWEEMYEYAKKYYEHYGNLEVPKKFKTNDGYTFDETGKINLKNWISYQRRTVSPDSEKGQLLLQIGMRFENKIKTATWEEMYEYAKKYYEHYGNLEVPFKFKTNDGFTKDDNGIINLGRWISSQRQRVSLDSEKGNLLLQIGMRFENKINTASWEEMYAYAKKYYEHYGNLEVPSRFKTNDGFKSDDNGKINLGSWISSQRQRVSPESEKGNLLSQIGMHFENKISTASWEEMYAYAKKYYEHYGNLEVSKKFKTNDGFTLDENGNVNLGNWIMYQRQNVSPDSEKGNLLLQIGMRFENIRSTLLWEEMYEYAKKYYEHYGNLEVPSKFKTTDGFKSDVNGKINLGRWISHQRQNVSPESEKGQLLSQIGMRFEKQRDIVSWNKMYEYAKKFYEHYGNLEVPFKFKTNDGFTLDENGKINLGGWIIGQRRNLSSESEKGKLLLQIGMRFEKKRDIVSWDKMYEYAKKFYEHYGKLQVPVDFRTDDGFTPNEKGKVNLGNWILEQRNSVDINSEQGLKLTSIGMIWDVKKHTRQLQIICIYNKINMEINKKILTHISVQELCAKIDFLKENNIPIVDNNGNLHEIFKLSNVNLKQKYNVSIESLISDYYLKNSKERSV